VGRWGKVRNLRKAVRQTDHLFEELWCMIWELQDEEAVARKGTVAPLIIK
jgi:hypothetical protein